MQVKKKKKEIKIRKQKHRKCLFMRYYKVGDTPVIPTLFKGSSPTNPSSGGGEGEGPRNEVDSLLSRIRYRNSAGSRP